jgi:hypothetical protein
MDIPKPVIGPMEISPIVVAGDSAVVLTAEETLEVGGIPLMTLSEYSKLEGGKEKKGHAGRTVFLVIFNLLLLAGCAVVGYFVGNGTIVLPF